MGHSPKVPDNFLPLLQNQRMREKVFVGEAVDLRLCPKTPEGDYVLTDFLEDVDYCDSNNEAWIWSIGKCLKTGQIFASTGDRYYRNTDFRCLFLR